MSGNYTLAKRAKNLRWQAENRDKYLAHKAVENAILAGRLSREPCERCGAVKNVHAHHDDYTRPLDVRWLCGVHHIARHRELGEIGGPVRNPELQQSNRGRLRKLTEEQLSEIIETDAPATVLAARFGVTPDAIRWHRKHHSRTFQPLAGTSVWGAGIFWRAG